MKRLPIIARTGIVVLAALISTLAIVLPREEQARIEPSPATDDRDFLALPEKPSTDDGKAFRPDWD
ncbi:hypothetical protein FJ945_20250 [Mesorhizobium sp. B2-4-9]|uniref:hypothetical protein n=1 Tax=Mesorhizobium sp. B2-4-9 TaxID=2589940 RepID=UPI00112EDC5B|nr:hypothetical protein [Mesorhizobium sp. B2-4-9]TPL21060.1 hypothetical protein FJ945_20250 [Mesorhizobium sp. B2-4-9]